MAIACLFCGVAFPACANFCSRWGSPVTLSDEVKYALPVLDIGYFALER